MNLAKLIPLLSQIPIRPRQAYVNCYNEKEATKAYELWDAVGRPPFVLYIVDILHPKLTEEETPHFLRLVRNASEVLCLNRLIEEEMRRGGAAATSLFPLASDVVPSPRKAPGEPFKVLISGALYANGSDENIAMKLLVEAWPLLKKAHPQAELHYSGASSRGLPAELRSHVHDHGFLSTDDYGKLVRSCHVAYVPVSHLQHTSLRFSIPSRIPDYLVQGLPVLACTAEDTAIAEFFRSTPRECSRLVHTADEFLSGIRDFAADPVGWEAASRAAIKHAKEEFALAPAREILFAKLNAAGAKASEDVA